MYRFPARVVLLVVISWSLLAGAVAPVLAQAATPAADGITVLGPDESFGSATPAASPVATSACTVRPRSVAEVRALWITPEGSPVPAMVELPPVPSTDLPSGQPVDAPTIEAIQRVVQEYWACSNAGDSLRVFALFTDDRVRQLAPPVEEREAILSTLAATPAPDEVIPPVSVSGVSEARLLPDGRVGALITIETAEGLMVRFFYVCEQQQDGRWLIDEEIMVS